MTTENTTFGGKGADSNPPADSSRNVTADDNSTANVEAADQPPVKAVGTSDSSSDIDRLTQEVADYKDRYLRTVAEMDNMRKRQEREKADFIKFSNETILKDMIPVLDSLDKAIPAESVDAAAASYMEGVLMVRKQFLQMLSKHGLEPIESVDKPFDPNLHQAIQRIESKEVSRETVGAEFAKGYSLYGRLVRPAMVSVKVPS